MLDPLGPPPAWLQRFTEPYAIWLNSPTLTLHIHEVVLAFAFYQFIHSVLSPWLSPIFFPNSYTKLSARTQLNWDIHVVSLVQSVLINALALWVIFVDKERSSMSTLERVFGYTGACGFIQALAAGYFVYDLIVSSRYVRMFGIGTLFHAICALWVFSLGFRPFVNYYAPVFTLYELSTPFLNIHWFLDKVNMTGSKAQWYNGMLLLSVFFSCRLIWGTWRSLTVYVDMWAALQQTWSASASPLTEPVNINAQVFLTTRDGMCIDEACARANSEISMFKDFTSGGAQTWLVLTYMTSSVTLNLLNYYWFSKMVQTVLKRFRVPASDEKTGKSSDKKGEPALEDLAQEVILEAAAGLEQAEGSPMLEENEKISAAVTSAAKIIASEENEEVRRRKMKELVSKVPLPGS